MPSGDTTKMFRFWKTAKIFVLGFYLSFFPNPDYDFNFRKRKLPVAAKLQEFVRGERTSDTFLVVVECTCLVLNVTAGSAP